MTVHPLCRSIVTLSAFFGTSPLENSASEPFSWYRIDTAISG